MKNIKTTGKIMMLAMLAAITVMQSCKKDDEFFDIEDPQGIDSKIWSDPGAVDLFLNRTYGLIMPAWPTLGGIHNTSDELNNANTAFLYGTLVENSVTDIGTANNITANRYYDIRRCNIALEGLNESTLPDATRQTLKGQFYFMRAFVYFRLINLYGGVPLILQSQTLEDELNVPRSKTSECIAAITRDLDSAAANLPASWAGNDIGRITRGAALAVKGKVLMYWASPQFNPTNIASRWEDAYQANLAAYTQCVADGNILLANYANLFITEDHKEILLVRKYNANRDLGNTIEQITRPKSETDGASGSNQPTWNMVQAYTMNNGLPTSHASSGYDNVMFWQNRDPRLAASVAYNGAPWALSGKAVRKQWTHTGVPDEPSGTIITGFYCRRFCNPALSAAQSVYVSASGGGSGMDWIEMRFAEVILNLAECANESGRLTEAKDKVRLIRQRAGIVAGTFDYGLAVATDAATMRSLILNERMVEFSMEGKRHFDLRRTRNLNLLSARQSYKLSLKSPYVTGAGTDITKIYFDMANTAGTRPRDTANLNNKSVYTSVYTTPGTIASLEGSNVITMPAKYYFYALPNFFSQSFFLEQTAGWINGTFDPLQ
ncbi:RagB/SusD family nutrient uptake outer membrane protein [Ferruginibacter sp.]|nr:RagB/SusD family nutrient uptake outer membrane protein [Ferruginibacter sp.]